MPGIFGAMDVEASVRGRLVSEWRAVWPTSDVVECSAGGVIGGLSLSRSAAVEELPDRGWVAIDGDVSTRTGSASFGLPDLLAGSEERPLRLNAWCRANLAFIDTSESRLELLSESTGSFPLFVAEYQNGLVFSSLLRPLARAIHAETDPLGSLEFLRNGYTYAGRTTFHRIRRLQAGQRLIYTGGNTETSETSQLWAGDTLDATTTAEIAEEAIPLLSAALSRGASEESRTALMMSAGWDSRTLLALLSSKGSPTRDVVAYSHGDLSSRELRLSHRVTEAAGVRFHAHEIDQTAFTLQAIESRFPRIECSIFPHWIRSGQVLNDMGVSQVVAGVFGEVLGGHYGETMIRQGGGKIFAFVNSLLGKGSGEFSDSSENWAQLRALLGTEVLKRPWYLSEEFMEDHPNMKERWNHDIDIDIGRLRSRGIESPTGVIEAFVSESRGSQYINAQLLSCRAHVRTSFPYIDESLLRLITRTPLSSRLHNRVSARIIERLDPKLLRFPLAATLVPASAPLLLQEASRAGRKLYGAVRWKLHSHSGGRIRHAHLGWSNFDFLRGQEHLRDLVDSLQGDQWDRKALRKVVSGMEDWDLSDPVQPLTNQLGKIHTVDMLMR